MSLNDIFDPIVRAYFDNHSGGSGGSTVDDGWCLMWDGNTEGIDVIDTAAALGFNYYKVSNLVFGVESLAGASIQGIDAGGGADNYGAIIDVNAVDGGAGVSLLQINDFPVVASCKSGEYPFIGFNFIVPSDGTYVADLTSVMGLQIRAIFKPAP